MGEKVKTFEEWFEGIVLAPEVKLCCAVAWIASGVEHEKEIDSLKTIACNHERAKLYTQEENNKLHEENEKLKAQIKEKEEQIKKKDQIILEIWEDFWKLKSMHDEVVLILNKQLKQKDAEIEKKDALLKEAVEILIHSDTHVHAITNVRSQLEDFLKKMEVGK